ncbi:hypothetical protein QAD02_009915 [Eretmocerus hayati]|uniref:Uncharacterized protein n=1 Tax=Eretmocerus hayati TaxID=131215 RepID=A0ACC2NAQ9_9HYME|nr:hypothetical protein QAD02_009915 [Eretmocerus hayati]
MLFIANMIIYGLKVNISTTVIGMVKSESNPDGYDWSKTEKGLVVSTYFAGYLIGMFPSGYFADRFNTKWVLLVCVFFNALFTLMVPKACDDLYVLYTLRFLTGLVSAANLPIVNVLVGKWVVYEEKSFLVGIIYAGTSLGTVVSILSSGWIMNDMGWQAVFYIHGAVPMIWVVLFFIFFADSPETQTFITEQERQMIVNSYGHRGPGNKEVKVPWKAIFSSCPFIALIFTNTLGNFTWYFLLTQMPLYMNNMLHFDIKSNTTITCLPYLVNVFTNTFIGKFLDFGRKREWWSQTGARKIAVGISCLPACVFLALIAFVFEGNRNVTVGLLCASIIFSGAIFVGHLTNQNDLAPNYAGILMGITNTPGTISAFLLPALIGALMENGDTIERWRYVFGLNIVAQLSAFLIFMMFGSAKIQDWNYPDGIIPPAVK